ncbi:Basic region leucin zipper containing protein [Klebsormidium nitens]|uniref:Basic region leucin zipper containing protein n=1 Tax=Klebsormidium nitens TaxID=105231 RepID=A0A0U9HJI0_KLENI|nr:Basic region leucin zipper containing protein [Klebsormidium nitens]|eukprot:GAQ82042.1 Basic region leucin zipper containing protein [Klebsormidium nitens]
MQREFGDNSVAVAVAPLPIARPVPRMAAPAQPLTQDELEMQKLIEQVLGNQPLTLGDSAAQQGPSTSGPQHVGHSKKERMLRRVQQEEAKNALLQAHHAPTTSSADMKPVLGVPPPGFTHGMPSFSPFGYFPPFGTAAPQLPMGNAAQEAAVKRMQRQTADQEKKIKRRRVLEGPSASRPPSLPIPSPLLGAAPPSVSTPRSSSSEGSNPQVGEEAEPVMLDGAPLVGLPPAKALGRKKRLLRNRVSAQQAREKKKLLLAQLEARVADLESRNASLDEEAAALVQQNEELRRRVRENIHKPVQSY